MVAICIAVSVGAADAASYYVDSTSGSDANSGTSSGAAWRSLSKVNATTFQPGDVVHFKRGGVWTGNLQIPHSGTATLPITYQAYGTGAAPQIKNPGVSYGSSVTISGDWNIVQDFLLTDAHESGVKIAAGGDRNVVRSTEITATGIGVLVSGQHNLVTGNNVHDLKMIINDATPWTDYGAVCFWLQAPNNEVSYNRGINCSAPSIDFGTDGGFVEVWQSGDNSFIHHNYAERTNGFFELGASGAGSAQNITVAYNVMHNTLTGVGINTGSYAISVSNFRFEHNTFVSTVGDGYRVFWGSQSGLIVRNNIFQSNVQIANSGSFTHTNNVYHMANMVNGSGVGYSLGSGEKVGNPLFVNLGAADFRVQIGSPAVDAGVNLGHTTDFAGSSVPSGLAPDMGAYEYGLPATAPAPPSNLRITQ